MQHHPVLCFDNACAGANHLFGCSWSKPSQGYVPTGLTLASVVSLCLQCRAGSGLVLRRPIEITALTEEVARSTEDASLMRAFGSCHGSVIAHRTRKKIPEITGGSTAVLTQTPIKHGLTLTFDASRLLLYRIHPVVQLCARPSRASLAAEQKKCAANSISIKGPRFRRPPTPHNSSTHYSPLIQSLETSVTH
jgi:hypothetical protein